MKLRLSGVPLMSPTQPPRYGPPLLTVPEFYQLASQKAALRLELAGLKHSSGRSVAAHMKRRYHLTGRPHQILTQVEALVANALAARESSHATGSHPQP